LAGSNGLTLGASATGFTVQNNSILGTTALSMSNGGVTTFINNSLESATSWIASTSFANNQFINQTFNNSNGKISFTTNFTLPAGTTVNQANLNITPGVAAMNSSNLTFMNVSAQIALNSIIFQDPRPTVDFEDDGSFTKCTEATFPGQCTEVSFNTSGNNVFVFNVSSFTSYSAQQDVFECPIALSSNLTLTQTAVGTSTCFSFAADNIVLDCNGFNIEYDGAGLGESSGVLADGRNNITVRNCNIIDVNASGDSSIAINFTDTDNSSVYNNSVTSNATSDSKAISLSNSNFNSIENNSVNSFGTGSTNTGILMLASASHNVVVNNVVFANATSAGSSISATGGGIQNNTYEGNNLTFFGGSGGTGIILGSSANATVASNNIFINLSGAGQTIGISGVSVESILRNNTVTAWGSSAPQALNLGGDFNTVYNNTFAGRGTGTSAEGARVTGEDNFIYNKSRLKVRLVDQAQ